MRLNNKISVIRRREHGLREDVSSRSHPSAFGKRQTGVIMCNGGMRVHLHRRGASNWHKNHLKYLFL